MTARSATRRTTAGAATSRARLVPDLRSAHNAANATKASASAIPHRAAPRASLPARLARVCGAQPGCMEPTANSAAPRTRQRAVITASASMGAMATGVASAIAGTQALRASVAAQVLTDLASFTESATSCSAAARAIPGMPARRVRSPAQRTSRVVCAPAMELVTTALLETARAPAAAGSRRQTARHRAPAAR